MTVPELATVEGPAVAPTTTPRTIDSVIEVQVPNPNYNPNKINAGLSDKAGDKNSKALSPIGNSEPEYITEQQVIQVPVDDEDAFLEEQRVLDEERLNPRGINVIKKKKGNFIMWGDRLPSLDPAFKFAHQREQLSHYENTFLEEFDFIIFSLNDPIRRELLKVAFRAFFIPEFAKGALRGNDFDDAVQIKIDDENNTTVSEAAGDLNAEIKLRLAETVERFVMTVSKAGIFESLG